jgi:hypothetical protein
MFFFLRRPVEAPPPGTIKPDSSIKRVSPIPAEYLAAPDTPINLYNFVIAQQEASEQAEMELFAGQKRSCWIWFLFPQILPTGFSSFTRKCAFWPSEDTK